jgi:hypothetical protein
MAKAFLFRKGNCAVNGAGISAEAVYVSYYERFI